MPCQVDDRYEREQRRYEVLKAEADKVTRLLCYTMRRLMNAGGDVYLDIITGNTELSEWWTEHRRVDHERVSREIASRIRTMPLDELEQVAKSLGIETD